MHRGMRGIEHGVYRLARYSAKKIGTRPIRGAKEAAAHRRSGRMTSSSETVDFHCWKPYRFTAYRHEYLTRQVKTSYDQDQR